MRYQILRRIVYALGAVVISSAVVGRILELGYGPTVLGAWSGPAASIAIMMPIGVCTAFLVLSVVPGGTRIVPIPATQSQDTMALILVLTQFCPHSEIRGLVPTGWMGAAREQTFVSLAMVLLCFCARVYQLRGNAQVNAVANAGASQTNPPTR